MREQASTSHSFVILAAWPDEGRACTEVGMVRHDVP